MPANFVIEFKVSNFTWRQVAWAVSVEDAITIKDALVSQRSSPPPVGDKVGAFRISPVSDDGRETIRALQECRHFLLGKL